MSNGLLASSGEAASKVISKALRAVSSGSSSVAGLGLTAHGAQQVHDGVLRTGRGCGHPPIAPVAARAAGRARSGPARPAPPAGRTSAPRCRHRRSCRGKTWHGRAAAPGRPGAGARSAVTARRARADDSDVDTRVHRLPPNGLFAATVLPASAHGRALLATFRAARRDAAVRRGRCWSHLTTVTGVGPCCGVSGGAAPGRTGRLAPEVKTRLRRLFHLGVLSDLD